MAGGSAFRLSMVAAGVSVSRRAFAGLVAAAGGLAGKAVFGFLAVREFSRLAIRASGQAASIHSDRLILDELEIPALAR